MIYLHDEVAFNSLEDSFDGFFQYNDGTAMPEDAKDYENAMVSWNDLKGFAEFVPQQPRRTPMTPSAHGAVRAFAYFRAGR